MNRHTRQMQEALRYLGDRWAVRTLGPLRTPTAAVRRLADQWRDHVDGLKQLYNGAGGEPRAPLPEHGVVSAPERRAGDRRGRERRCAT